MSSQMEGASPIPEEKNESAPISERAIDKATKKRANIAYSITTGADAYSGKNLVYFPARLEKVREAVKELEEIKAQFPDMKFPGILKRELSIDDVISRANANIQFSEEYNAKEAIPVASLELESEAESDVETNKEKIVIKEATAEAQEASRELVKGFQILIGRLEGLPEFVEGKALLVKAEDAQQKLMAQLAEIGAEETAKAKEELANLISEAKKINFEIIPNRIVSWTGVDGNKLVGVVVKLPEKGKGVKVKVKNKEYIVNRDELNIAAPEVTEVTAEVDKAKNYTELKNALPAYLLCANGVMYSKEDLVKAIELVETGSMREGGALMQLIPKEAGLGNKVLELLKPHLVGLKRKDYSDQYAQVTKKYGGALGWMRKLTNKGAYAEDMSKLKEAKDSYIENRAELVADNIDKWATEQIQLSDAKADAFQKEKGWGSKLYDAYRNNKFIKKFNKGRAIVGLGLLGAGLAGMPVLASLGMAGVGYVAMSRAFGFVGGSIWAYEYMSHADNKKGTKATFSKDQKIELKEYEKKLLAKAKTKEEKKLAKEMIQKKQFELQTKSVSTLPDKKLDEVISYYQTEIVRNGQKLSEEPKFQMLMKEKVRRMKLAVAEVKGRNVELVKKNISAEDKNLVDRAVDTHVEMLAELEKQKFIDFFKIDQELYQLQHQLSVISPKFPDAKKRFFLNRYNAMKKAKEKAYASLSPEMQTLVDERMATLPSGREKIDTVGVFSAETNTQFADLKKQPNLYHITEGENGNYKVFLPIKVGDKVKVESRQFKSMKEVKKAIEEARSATGEKSISEKMWEQSWSLEELYNSRINEVLHNSSRLKEEAQEFVLSSFDNIITTEEQKQKRIETTVSQVEFFLATQLKKTDSDMEDALLKKQWDKEKQRQIRKGLALCVGVILGSGALNLARKNIGGFFGIGVAEAGTLPGHGALSPIEDAGLNHDPSLADGHEVGGHGGSGALGGEAVDSHHGATAGGAIEEPTAHEGHGVDHGSDLDKIKPPVTPEEPLGSHDKDLNLPLDHEILPSYQEQTFEFGQGDSVHRIMDLETMNHGQEMFPGEWEKVLSEAGGNETIAKQNFGEFIHDWKMQQLKDLGYDWVKYEGSYHYGYPFTPHVGAELSFVQDPDALGGWKIEMGADHITEHNGLKFPTLPEEAWSNGSVRTVLGANIDAPAGVDLPEVANAKADLMNQGFEHSGGPVDSEALKEIENIPKGHGLADNNSLDSGTVEESPATQPVSEAEVPVAQVPAQPEIVQPVPEADVDKFMSGDPAKDLPESFKPGAVPVPVEDVPNGGGSAESEHFELKKEIVDSHSTASSHENVTHDGDTTTRERTSKFSQGAEMSGFSDADYKARGILSEDWQDRMREAKGPSQATKRNMILSRARQLLLGQNEMEKALEAGDTTKAEIIKEKLATMLQKSQSNFPGVFGDFLEK